MREDVRPLGVPRSTPGACGDPFGVYIAEGIDRVQPDNRETQPSSVLGIDAWRQHTVRAVVRLAALVLLACVACGQPSTAGTIVLPANVESCRPSDQDPYTYRPARLRPLLPCIRVVGTVVSSELEQDGDAHINVRLDDAYRGVLVPGNDAEDGNLIVEPVCQFPPLQADAIRVCAADAAPLLSVPAVGDHVWLEGRYVLDLQHHSWAELHPLYRWGHLTP